MSARLSLLLLIAAIGSLVAALPARAAEQPLFETTTVFPVTPKNKPNYRIPSLIQARNGDLIAFAEKRNDGIGDVGNHDLVLKRSRDLGKTWGPEQVIYDDGSNTSTDGTVCVDREKNRIFLFFLKDKKQFAYMRSDDGAETWQGPTIIHTAVIKPEWDRLGLKPGETLDSHIDPESGKTSKTRSWKENWVQRYGIGPGNSGIQLTKGPHAGRLLVPVRHREEAKSGKFQTFANIIYSDDHGATWTLGPNIAEFGSETQLVELANGDVLASMRNENPRDLPEKRQLLAVSKDSGMTWNAARKQPELITPKVHASIRRLTMAGTGDKNRLLFSNPAYPRWENKHPYGRYNMTVRLSYDEGDTWTAGKLLYAPPASYSDLVALSDGTIGIIYERGPEGSDHYWDELQFARFNLEWLTDGKDSLPP